jgi:hypothetical protein
MQVCGHTQFPHYVITLYASRKIPLLSYPVGAKGSFHVGEACTHI